MPRELGARLCYEEEEQRHGHWLLEASTDHKQHLTGCPCPYFRPRPSSSGRQRASKRRKEAVPGRSCLAKPKQACNNLAAARPSCWVSSASASESAAGAEASEALSTSASTSTCASSGASSSAAAAASTQASSSARMPGNAASPTRRCCFLSKLDSSTAAREAWENNLMECSVCGSRLGKRRLRPQHHCRLCRQPVCNDCSKSRVELSSEAWRHEPPQRVCKRCMMDVVQAPALRTRLDRLSRRLACLSSDEATDSTRSVGFASTRLEEALESCESALAAVEASAPARGRSCPRHWSNSPDEGASIDHDHFGVKDALPQTTTFLSNLNGSSLQSSDNRPQPGSLLYTMFSTLDPENQQEDRGARESPKGSWPGSHVRATASSSSYPAANPNAVDVRLGCEENQSEGCQMMMTNSGGVEEAVPLSPSSRRSRISRSVPPSVSERAMTASHYRSYSLSQRPPEPPIWRTAALAFCGAVLPSRLMNGSSSSSGSGSGSGGRLSTASTVGCNPFSSLSQRRSSSSSSRHSSSIARDTNHIDSESNNPRSSSSNNNYSHNVGHGSDVGDGSCKNR